MNLGQSLARKLTVPAMLAVAAATVAAPRPAMAQYYYNCPAGYYYVPAYGCLPYAYAPGYGYPYYDYYGYGPFGYIGGWGGWGGWEWGHRGGWGRAGGWGHGGWGHGGGFHGGGGHGR